MARSVLRSAHGLEVRLLCFGNRKHHFESGAFDGLLGDSGERHDEIRRQSVADQLSPRVPLHAAELVPLAAHQTRNTQLRHVHVRHDVVQNDRVEQKRHFLF